MKRNSIGLICLIGLVCAQPMHAVKQTTKKITIKEYFFLLPTEAMPADLSEAENRKAAITRKAGTDQTVGLITHDPKNGYLELGYKSNGQNASYEFAIWRTTDGVDLIGINELYSGIGGVTGKTRFFSRKGSDWHDVTAEVFGDFQPKTFSPVVNAPQSCGNDAPPIDIAQGFSCKLPQKGLNITCRFTLNCETETKYSSKNFFRKPIVNFIWKKDKFHAK
jgi:hypothetical protein